MPAMPKHHTISRRLLDEVAAGKYAPGERLPSEAQLVKKYRVSRPTVARALRDLQAQGLIERRAGSGTYLRENAPAPTEIGARQLGLLIPGLGTTEIFEHICGELASLARVHACTLLWGGSAHPRQAAETSSEQAEALCEQFLQQRVAGVFLAPFEHRAEKEDANRRLAERLRQSGVAVVLLDRDLGVFPARSDFDLVSMDNFTAGYVLADHLLKLGCRKFAFVTRAHSAPTVDARIAGAREALQRTLGQVAGGFVRIGEPDEVRFVRSLVAGRTLDAVICANDFTAARLLRTLAQLGCRVPRDLRVAGFDDAKYATLVSPPLTTIHQPCREIASISFRTMLDRIAEPTSPPRQILVSPRLVVRESCGAYLRA